MLEHVLRCLPEEACGLLAGRGDEVSRVLPVSNVLRSPFRFRMEPRAQLEAMQAIEGEGLEMLGIYHSHPRGPAGPSPIDLAEAAYPEALHLIWWPGKGGWEVRAYEFQGEDVHPVDLLVERETSGS